MTYYLDIFLTADTEHPPQDGVAEKWRLVSLRSADWTRGALRALTARYYLDICIKVE